MPDQDTPRPVDGGPAIGEVERTRAQSHPDASTASATPDPRPANATPDDRRIHDEIRRRLPEHPDVEPDRIEVQVREGDVTLVGTTQTRYAKQHAQDAAEAVEGVAAVHNHLHVQPHTPGGPVLTTHLPGVNTEGSTQRS